MFTTYENGPTDTITIHFTAPFIGCGHPGKHGGKVGYRDHRTYAEARAHAESTGRKVRDCTFCEPRSTWRRALDLCAVGAPLVLLCAVGARAVWSKVWRS